MGCDLNRVNLANITTACRENIYTNKQSANWLKALELNRQHRHLYTKHPTQLALGAHWECYVVAASASYVCATQHTVETGTIVPARPQQTANRTTDDRQADDASRWFPSAPPHRLHSFPNPKQSMTNVSR